ncbi:DUF6457 domain-containing protein [Cellulomonas chengniuliangii]|uniref:DUF6457 domain-containing protein n=1 Tax=Cellulomonas chengniuliangii TaxID=2968084 RepID=A0ABY5KZC3_9CELL|nr:DUF6457 domain-containing protein [Cellulomonas chengniuliangii]MCC2310017.1 DUF6457 domain-containing protein [Cellulomonas chengniuliangii]MCC2316999.1 DUF6457 domain-containing protein [Cellulomonas chengniuliangii]UUI74586.1 DUF6457 domain-containing protein [Cellulomonas chengniuliangii]
MTGTTPHPDHVPPDRHIEPPTTPLDAWVHTLARDLGVDVGVVDEQALTALAQHAARSVGRPGASPLTAFLVGYAAGIGAGPLTDAIHRADDLATDWYARYMAMGGPHNWSRPAAS